MEFKEVRDNLAKTGVDSFFSKSVEALSPNPKHSLIESLSFNSKYVLKENFNKELKINGDVFLFVSSLALNPHIDQVFIEDDKEFAQHVVSFVFKNNKLFNWDELKFLKEDVRNEILKKHWELVDGVKNEMMKIWNASDLFIYGGCGAKNHKTKKAQSIKTMHTHILKKPCDIYPMTLDSNELLYQQNIWNLYMEKIFHWRELIHLKLEQILNKPVFLKECVENISPAIFSISCENGEEALRSIQLIESSMDSWQNHVHKKYGNEELKLFNIPESASFAYQLEKNANNDKVFLHLAPTQSGPAEIFNNKIFKINP